MLTEHTFDSGGVAINYAEGPTSGPLLVLLHGVTSRWQRFLPVLPVLTQRWHVVAVDLRGHGRSGRLPGRYGLMEYAQDVIGLIRHLGEGPAAVLGHSLGAMVGIGVAAEAPSDVRALILEDPPLGAFMGRPFTTRPEHNSFVAMRDLSREGHPPEELARLLAARSPDGDALAARLRAWSLSQIDPDVLTLIIENRAVDGYDLEARLQAVTCPTLLLQGNPDLGGALSDEEAGWAASLMPRCMLASMPDIGHQILTAPGVQSIRSSQIVSGFLETV
jgi:pimeloyl-ACP methyl ester carboxylesterase